MLKTQINLWRTEERVADLERHSHVMHRVSIRVLAMIPVLALIFGVGPASAKVVITYYHRSNTTEVEWANAVIERFNAQHPDIEVQSLPSGTGGGARYAEKLALLRVSDTAPDVFFGSTDKLGFILNGWTLDLTPYVERDREQLQMDTFFPGVWESFTRQGRIHGVPLTVTPQFVFYNKDMFQTSGLPFLPVSWEDLSWTWDQLVEYSRKLVRYNPDGSAAQLALTQATESQLPDVVWMFGGDWFDDEAYRTGRAERSTFYRPENIEAYTAVRDYYAQFAAAGQPKGLVADDFMTGAIAMDWIGAWKMNNYFEAERSGGMGFNWGMAPVPLAASRENTRWTDPLYISSTTEHPDAAWEFVKFATSDEAQSLWATLTGKIPARISSVDAYVDGVAASSGMSAEEIVTAVSGALAHSRTSLEESVADVQLEIRAFRSEFIESMLAGERPIESTLEAFDALLNAKLAEWNQNR